jgi:hypothetical protein
MSGLISYKACYSRLKPYYEAAYMQLRKSSRMVEQLLSKLHYHATLKQFVLYLIVQRTLPGHIH